MTMPERVTEKEYRDFIDWVESRRAGLGEAERAQRRIVEQIPRMSRVHLMPLYQSWVALGKPKVGEAESPEKRYYGRLGDALQDMRDAGQLSLEDVQTILDKAEKALKLKPLVEWTPEETKSLPLYGKLTDEFAWRTGRIERQKAIAKYQREQQELASTRQPTAYDVEQYKYVQGTDKTALQRLEESQQYERDALARARGERPLTMQQTEEGIQREEESNASWLNRMRTGGAPSQVLPNADALTAEWELLKQQSLRGLGSPRSWIDRWMIEHMPAPISAAQRGFVQPHQKLEMEQQTLARLMEAKAWADTHPPAIPNSPYFNEIQSLNDVLASQQEAVADAQRSFNEIMGSPERFEQETELAAARQPREVGLPPTPDWMNQLVPGMRGAIQKGRQVPTPSLQQWETFNPSQQQQFAGYLDWAGINFEDVMANMLRGRPRTPSGAGFSRWSPISQGR